MAQKSPAYQWYPKDILASARVAEMPASVDCWYRRALDFCWINGSLPADPVKLAAVIGKGCKASACREYIIGMFELHPEDPTRIIHERQEQERNKQKKFSDARRGNANMRWHQETTESDASASVSQCESDALLLQSSSTSPDGDEGPPPSPKSSRRRPKPPAPEPDPEPFLSLEANKDLALADKSENGFLETCYRIGLKPEPLAGWLDAFHRQLAFNGVKLKQHQDYRSHFARWLKFQPYRTEQPQHFSPIKEPKPQQNTQTEDGYHAEKQRIEAKTRELSGRNQS